VALYQGYWCCYSGRIYQIYRDSFCVKHAAVASKFCALVMSAEVQTIHVGTFRICIIVKCHVPDVCG